MESKQSTASHRVEPKEIINHKTSKTNPKRFHSPEKKKPNHQLYIDHRIEPATRAIPATSRPATLPALIDAAPLLSPVAVVDALGVEAPDDAEPVALAAPEAPALAEVPVAEAFALAWYAEKDLSAVGLMANTIPAAQWLAGLS